MSPHRDNVIERRRARWRRRRVGYLLWWLLLPGWRYRQGSEWTLR